MLIFYDNIIFTQRQISTTVSEICAKNSSLLHTWSTAKHVPTIGVSHLLPSATMLRRLLFTPVCLSMGESASVHAGMPPPQKQTTPPGADPPGADPPEADPPWSRPPWSRPKPPRADTPPPMGHGYCCGQYSSYWNAFL